MTLEVLPGRFADSFLSVVLEFCSQYLAFLDTTDFKSSVSGFAFIVRLSKLQSLTLCDVKASV